MDSGNSGSVQSSSGGSEEFDSRADSISSLFNQQPPPPPPLMQQQHQSHFSSSMLFDPYFVHPSPQLANNPNPLLNLDSVWSKNLRSELNCNDLVGFMASSSSSSQTQQLQSRATFSSMQSPQGKENGTKLGSVSGTTTDHQPVCNSKKRSRASQRAPTTVLTTDTTNFRAMVQEFTGIPAPPFTSSPFTRTRLDLFGGTPSFPHNLLRPFAQKFHFSPSITTSSMVDAIASTPSTNSSSTSTSINYQLPQNPILNYVSLLQPPPKYAIPSNDPPLKMGVFEDFSLSQGHGSNITNNLMASSPEATGSTQEQHDQSLLRSINGSYNSNTQ